MFVLLRQSKESSACEGASLLLCSAVLVLFIFMLICFGRVMSKLTVQQYRNNQGLHMIPDYDTRTGNGILSLARDKVAKERYVEIIHEYIEAYKKEQMSRANFTKECGPSERFPLKSSIARLRVHESDWLDSGVLLFSSSCSQAGRRSSLATSRSCPFKCDAYDQASLRKNPEVKIISAFGNGTQDGFPVNKIPSRAISDGDGRDVSDENGETLYDQPALVFVKIRLDRSIHTSVRCSLAQATTNTAVLNLASLPGNRVVNFDLFYPYVQ
ncbi:hypothetical protein OSTOST_24598 [Ostertagia ostertagi]